MTFWDFWAAMLLDVICTRALKFGCRGTFQNSTLVVLSVLEVEGIIINQSSNSFGTDLINTSMTIRMTCDSVASVSD